MRKKVRSRRPFVAGELLLVNMSEMGAAAAYEPGILVGFDPVSDPECPFRVVLDSSLRAHQVDFRLLVFHSP